MSARAGDMRSGYCLSRGGRFASAMALVLVLAMLSAPMISAGDFIENVDISSTNKQLENTFVLYELRLGNKGDNEITTIEVNVPENYENDVTENDSMGWLFTWDSENRKIVYSGNTLSAGNPSPPIAFKVTTPTLTSPYMQPYTWVITAIDNAGGGSGRGDSVNILPAIIWTGITDNGDDTDEDSYFNYLHLEVPLNVSQPGTYIISAELRDNENETLITQTNSATTSFPSGISSAHVYFNGSSIYNSSENAPYNVRMSLKDDLNNVLDTAEYYVETLYTYDNFEPPAAAITDANITDNIDDQDYNGLYDYLTINVPITVNSAAGYRLMLDLYDNENQDTRTRITSTFSEDYYAVGDYTISVNFDGRTIYGSGENSPYYVLISFRDQTDTQVDSAQYFVENTAYTYDNFEIQPARISGDLTVENLDNDADGDNDYIVVNIPMEIITAGTYTIQGSLWNENSEVQGRAVLAWCDYSKEFENTDNLVTLYFDGRRIYSSKENGPYYVEARLQDQSRSDLNSKSAATEFYDYEGFSAPPAWFSTDIPHTVENGDTDNDGLLDYLMIKAQVVVATAGEYSFRSELRDSNGDLRIAETWATQSFESPGNYEVNLEFSGNQIYQSGQFGPFRVSLVVEDPSTQYRVENSQALSISGYSYFLFKSSKAMLTHVYTDNALDTNADNYFEYLNVDVGVRVTENGRYYLEGSLQDNNWNWITWAKTENDMDTSVENYTLTISFDGSQIRRSQENGPYKVYIRLMSQSWSWLGDELYQTDNDNGPDNYCWENFSPPLVYFVSGEHTDENENTGEYYETITVNVKLNVGVAGLYHINADLKNSDGWRMITHTWADNWLDVGSYTIPLVFRGSDIYRAQENASYHVEFWLWGETESTFINDQGTYDITGTYTYDEFDRPAAYVQNSGHTDALEEIDNENSIVVYANIKVRNDGVYSVNGCLMDNNHQFISWNENRRSLTTTDNTVKLVFNGAMVRASGLTPGKVMIALMDENWQWLGDYEYALTSDYTDTDSLPALPISFDSASYAGEDEDNDGYYDYLNVDVTLNVTRAGRYNLGADLLKENVYGPNSKMWIGWAESRSNLGAGSQTVRLRFNGSQIYIENFDEPYNVQVHLSGESWEWYGDVNIDITGYSHENFQPAPMEFVGPHTSYASDTDNNGLYNYIIENIKVNVNKTGKYRIGGMIMGASSMSSPGGPEKPLAMTFTDVDLSAGNNQTIQLSFDTTRIYSSGENGPYFVGFALMNENFEPLMMDKDQTQSYTYSQFETPAAEFSDSSSHSDAGEDADLTDDDNNFDFLVLKVMVRVTTAGTYTVASQIWYDNWSATKKQPIDWGENTVYLDVGEHEVQLKFDGYAIVKNAVEGTIKAEIVLLDNNRTVLDLTTPPYETNNYSYAQFKETKTGHFAIVANMNVPTTTSGQTVSVGISDNDVDSVTQVDLAAQSDLNGAKLDLTEQSEKPPGAAAPDGTTMGYLDITVFGSENVRNATIHFKISAENVRAENLDLDNIHLMHYNENTSLWETLPTTLDNVSTFDNGDNEYYYFSAVTTSFSYFGITGGTVVATTTEETPTSYVAVSINPALYSFGALSMPATMTIGGTTSLTMSVNNYGGVAGTYTASLKMDGVIVQTTNVTLSAGATGQVSFNITPSAVGTYTVELAGKVATLSVLPEVTIPTDLIQSMATLNITSITTAAPVIFDVTGTNITQIALSVLRDAENVTLVVQQLTGRPSGVSDPSGSISNYFEITAEKLENTSVSSAAITFKVAKSWLAEENVDENSVILMRYHSDQWENLTTEKLSEDENYIYFTATTPGFSVFAVSGAKTAATSLPETSLPTLPTQPFASVPPVYLVVITAFVLVIVIIMVLWRYISLGTKGLQKTKKAATS
jgi:PGF-pre-PGF domain-containing protein